MAYDMDGGFSSTKGAVAASFKPNDEKDGAASVINYNKNDK
jgi:hypothetical protein